MRRMYVYIILFIKGGFIMKIEEYYASRTKRDVNLRYCGYEECASDFRMPPHTRSEYLIHYITQGRGTYICEGRTYPIRRGELFIIYPSQLVSYHTSPEEPLHFSWIAFTGDHADTLTDQLGFSHNAPVHKLHPQYSISEDIQTLAEQLSSAGFCNDFTIQSLIYSIFSNIAQSYSLSGNYQKESQTVLFEHIGKAKSYIKSNYIYPITVQDIVDHVGLERSYFSKIFHKFTGTTAQNYLLNLRIQRSKLLLERTDYTVREICSYVGMKDEYYFSRAFKRSVGLSPTQYRRGDPPAPTA